VVELLKIRIAGQDNNYLASECFTSWIRFRINWQHWWRDHL